jgi:hypothetical protein
LGELYRPLSSSLCSFLHSRYLVPIRPKYSPQNSYSQTPSAYVHQVPYPQKTTGKLIIRYILIFKFLNSKLEEQRGYYF